MFINFRKIKDNVSMKDALQRYGITEFKKDGSFVGKCPLHNGDNPTAFHASGYKWNCFTKCNRGGTVIDFVAMKENLSTFEAAKKLVEWFNLSNGSRKKKKQVEKVRENKPLKFKLKLEAEHPYLKERRINDETVEYFKIGFCRKGIMKERIAIPVHNSEGQLLAYIGRAVNGSKAKYRIPKGFFKSDVLFNLHRAKNHAKNGLIVVEGVFDVFRLFQAGFKNVVAVIGSSLSEKQAELIVKHTDKAILLFDGDEAGIKGMLYAAGILSQKILVRSVVLNAPNNEPDLVNEDELKKIIFEVL